jgi:hypothetical protein
MILNKTKINNFKINKKSNKKAVKLKIKNAIE